MKGLVEVAVVQLMAALRARAVEWAAVRTAQLEAAA